MRWSLGFVGSNNACDGRRSDLDLGHQHHVDDSQTIIDPHDHRGPFPGRMRDEIGMGNVNSCAIRQAKRKRPERCGVDHLSQVFWPQVRGSSID